MSRPKAQSQSFSIQRKTKDCRGLSYIKSLHSTAISLKAVLESNTTAKFEEYPVRTICDMP